MELVKRVALSFPLRLGPWPDIVRGIYRYAGGPVSWVISFHTEEDVSLALATNPDGVIAMIRTPDALAKLRAWGGPVIDAAYDLDDNPFPQVGFDAVAIGRLAADHLFQLRGRAYAILGDDSPAGRHSRAGFLARLREAGCEAIVGPADFGHPYVTTAEMDRARAAWVAALPRPAAVFTQHDSLAHWIGEACRVAGLRVPEEVAILGCLNDEFLCTTAQPQLSSIRLPVPALGYEAARLLDARLGGATVPQRVEFPPLGVVVRHSTDPTAVVDPELAQALRFLREHATERIGVEDIVTASGLSRSSLERRFRAAVGHGPLAELLQQRVELAKHLLAETHLAIKEIAARTGFHDVRHLSVTFRQRVGTSPTEFRARYLRG